MTKGTGEESCETAWKANYYGGWIILAFGFLMFFGGLAILCFQVGSWLKYGQWKSCPLLLVFEWVMPDALHHWLADTTSWVGLKRLVAGALTAKTGEESYL